MPPVPLQSQEGIWNVTGTSDIKCPQFSEGQVIGQEDCLFLNIFVPFSFSSNMPVMFWIYGGSFIVGSNNIDFYGSSNGVFFSVQFYSGLQIKINKALFMI